MTFIWDHRPPTQEFSLPLQLPYASWIPVPPAKKGLGVGNQKCHGSIATVAFSEAVGRLAYQNRFLSENLELPTGGKVPLVKSKIDFDKPFAQNYFLAPTLKHQ